MKALFIPLLTLCSLSACTKEIANQNFSLSQNTIDRIKVVGNKPSNEKESAFCAANGGQIEVRGRYQGEQFSTIDTLGLIKLDCSNLNLKVQWLDSNGVFTGPSQELESKTSANCNLEITDSRFNGNTSSGTRIKVVSEFKNNPSSALALDIRCDAPPADSLSEIILDPASCYQNNKTLEARGYRTGIYFSTKGSNSNSCADMEFQVNWINQLNGSVIENDVAIVDNDCKLIIKSSSNFLKGVQPGRALKVKAHLKVNPKAVKESGLRCY